MIYNLIYDLVCQATTVHGQECLYYFQITQVAKQDFSSLKYVYWWKNPINYISGHTLKCHVLQPESRKLKWGFY